VREPAGGQEPGRSGQPWSRNARYLALFLAGAVLLLVLYAAHDLLGPLLISAFLAYLFNPLVTLATRRSRLPRKVVITLLYVFLLALLVFLALTLAPALAERIRNLSLELQTIVANLERLLAQRIVIFGLSLQPEEILGDPESLSARFFGSERVLAALTAATTNLGWVLVILVTTFYLLQDWTRLRDWFFGLAPAWAEMDVRRLYDEIKLVWQNYLRGQLVLMIFVGVVTWLGLEAIGLPGAGALGLLTGLLDIIPTLGPTLAMVAAALIAVSEGSSYLPLSNLWASLLTILLYVLIQAVENVWLRPQIMSSRLQIHPAVVFVGVVAALYLLGMLGALVVVPVLGTLAIIGNYLRCRILELDPWPSVDRVIEPVEAEVLIDEA
jgi:predicted PurR-regulated permease PerM